jgi:hypothetical protein
MVKRKRTPAEIERTAVHEAGHAVCYIALGLGLKALTVVPDYDDMSAGSAVHGGEYGRPAADFGEKNDPVAELRSAAEDAFFLRHACAAYAGAEAVRQLRPDFADPDADAESDFDYAVDQINRITADPESIDLYFKLARRRCEVFVDHYRPEIEAIAVELISRKKITGDEARKVFSDTLLGRHARRLRW